MQTSPKNPTVVYFVGPPSAQKNREWEFLSASKVEAEAYQKANKGYIIKEKKL